MKKYPFGSGKVEYEIGRLLFKKIGIFILFLFFGISIFLVYSGIQDYKNLLSEKEAFLEYEKNIFKKYVNYHQYADSGFRVLYTSSKFSIYCGQGAVFDNLYTYIDMSEIIKINQSAKGKNIFEKKSAANDVAGFIFFFGSLTFLSLGLLSYKNEKYFFNFSNVFIKLAILDCIIVVLLIVIYFLPLLWGIPTVNFQSYFLFAFCLLLFLNFFYSIGLTVRTAISNKMGSIVASLLIWLFSMFVAPGAIRGLVGKEMSKLPSNETYNTVKTEVLMNFERETKEAVKGMEKIKEIRGAYKRKAYEFFDTGYQKNAELEREINKEVGRVIGKYSWLSSFYPSVFYNHFCGEISSKGYYGYLEFLDRIIDVRHEFVKFSLNKMYNSEDKKLEPFVKANENLFKAKSFLPKNFLAGFSITALYTIVLFLASFFIIRRRLNRKKETFKPDFEFEENGDMVYILCENEEYQEKIFNYYQEREDCICIDNVRGEDIDPGLSLKQTALYFCKLLNARIDRTFEHIEQLGIADIKTHPHTPEAIKKIYCAACMAVEKDTIVFKDFLDRESRDFEVKFRQLLKDTIDMERNFIYIRTETPKIDSEFTAPGNVDKYALIPMRDPREFIIR